MATRYVYDPFGNLLAEADDQNNITRKYIYGGGVIAMATPDARYCYHFNGTGSTVALTDMTGTVVNSYAYEPFGQILAEQESIPQPFKFVGKYGVMAEPNGLYYMRARYYDPTVGRFISEDPLGFGGGDVNLYAYVMNNPISLIDPSGLSDVGISSYEGHEYSLTQARGISYDLQGELYIDGNRVKITLGMIPPPGLGGLTGAVEGTACRGAISAGVRTEARNLTEQLTLKEAQAGAGNRIMQGQIKDPRFPEDTWAKMQHVHEAPEGESIVIHYWQQLKEGFRTGFKFKD